jgi:hypothetical protein
MIYLIHLIEISIKVSRFNQVVGSLKSKSKKVSIIEDGYDGIPNNRKGPEEVICEFPLTGKQKTQVNEIIRYRQVLYELENKLCQESQLDTYKKISLP